MMSWSGWTVKWTSRVNRVSPWSPWWKLQTYRPKHGSVIFAKSTDFALHNENWWMLSLPLLKSIPIVLTGAVLYLQSSCFQTQAQSGLAKRREPIRAKRTGQWTGKRRGSVQRYRTSCCRQCRNYRSQAWNGPWLSALCNVMLTLHIMLRNVMLMLTFMFPVTA